ncbi:hypothetical protein C0992_007348 [Termitomyces sp. T32_za158]|nr:hypothetical protein C0992_007348 [Termitomyces sp. T32_za158]
MSSPPASTSLISSAVLAARAYVPKLDMFLASFANVGPGADQKTVVSAMKVFEKWLWHKDQTVDVIWSWENELWEWCMAWYMKNSGAAWLASFKANFAPISPSIDEQLVSLLADDGPFMVQSASPMDLACQERQWADAATQSAAIMLAEREAELLEKWRVALAKLLAKRTADAQVAGFLEAVEVGATSGGDVVGTGEAAERSAVAAVEAAAAEPADESEAPKANDDADDKDDVLVTPKRVPIAGNSGRLPVVIKRTSKSTIPFKRRTQKVVLQYEAVLVRRAKAFVLEQRKLSAAGKVISISVSSLALPTAQELGCVVDVVDLVPPTPKGKVKATSTPHKQRASASGDERPAKQSRSSTASWKVTKTISCWEETPPVVGPSRQIIPVNPVEPVLHPGGVVLSDPELSSRAKVQSEYEEEAELSDTSESLSEVPVVPQRMVQPNYAPLLTPHVNGQEFIWLGKVLDYPISTLCPAKYIEAAKEKAERMTAVLRKDMRVAALEIEGLRLRKKIIEHSVDILEQYQADCTEALEWRQANEAHLQQPFATLFPLPPGTSLDP